MTLLLASALAALSSVVLSNVALSNVASGQDAGPASDWRYVVPPRGEAQRRPSLVALPLGDAVPEGVRYDVALDGRPLRFGVLRFGDADSTRVTVALESLEDGTFALYADSNRDLLLAEGERVAPAEQRRWELSLPCATRDAEGLPLLVPRRVAFELGSTGTILGVATLGWLEGTVEIGDREVAVRRRDAGCNGFFHDDTDHLWIDRNGDGLWAPMEELFVVQPVLSFDETRYAVRSNRLGDGLRFEKIDGTGTIRIAVPDGNGTEREDVVDASILLVGRDGSAVLVRAPGAPTEVPVGEYRPTMVTLRLADPNDREPWSYVFAERHAATPERWRNIAKGDELTLDPVGALEFELAKVGDFDEIEAGGSLRAQPWLHTGDRLLVTTAYRGRVVPAYRDSSMGANVSLVRSDGVRLATGNSGFA